MKNLKRIYDVCVNEVTALGIETGYIAGIEINHRAQNRWGQCRLRNGVYYINISARLLEDDTDIKGVKETVIHEILHTCKGCMNHGTEWKRLANKVNRAYGYNVSRTKSCEELGIDSKQYREERNMVARYKIVCDKCGAACYRNRASDFVKHPEWYTHTNCGGHFKLA